jgi:hypothetical protein
MLIFIIFLEWERQIEILPLIPESSHPHPHPHPHPNPHPHELKLSAPSLQLPFQNFQLTPHQISQNQRENQN